MVEDPRALKGHLAAFGIESALLWDQPHKQSPSASEHPEAAYLREHVLCLPIHQDVRRNDLERMADAIRGWRGAAE